MKLGRLLEYYGFRVGSVLVRRTPARVAQRMAEVAASRFFARRGRRVSYVLTNLRICFPDLSEEERYEIGRRSYVNIVWNMIDFMCSGAWDRDEILRRFEFKGVENYEAAVARGKGVILLMPHLGNFELGALAAPLCGVNATAVGRPISNRRLYTHLARERTRTGGGLIGKRNVAPAILRELRKGGGVVILNDQYSRRSRGVFAPFFGIRCSTAAGVATLALRAGSTVLPSYVVRDGPEHHTGRILPPISFTPTGEIREDIVAATAAYNRAYEEIIRQHPDQYWWSTRRFRYSPDLPGDPYA